MGLLMVTSFMKGTETISKHGKQVENNNTPDLSPKNYEKLFIKREKRMIRGLNKRARPVEKVSYFEGIENEYQTPGQLERINFTRSDDKLQSSAVQTEAPLSDINSYNMVPDESLLKSSVLHANDEIDLKNKFKYNPASYYKSDSVNEKNNFPINFSKQKMFLSKNVLSGNEESDIRNKMKYNQLYFNKLMTRKDDEINSATEYSFSKTISPKNMLSETNENEIKNKMKYNTFYYNNLKNVKDKIDTVTDYCFLNTKILTSKHMFNGNLDRNRMKYNQLKNRLKTFQERMNSATELYETNSQMLLSKNLFYDTYKNITNINPTSSYELLGFKNVTSSTNILNEADELEEKEKSLLNGSFGYNKYSDINDYAKIPKDLYFHIDFKMSTMNTKSIDNEIDGRIKVKSNSSNMNRILPLNDENLNDFYRVSEDVNSSKNMNDDVDIRSEIKHNLPNLMPINNEISCTSDVYSSNYPAGRYRYDEYDLANFSLTTTPSTPLLEAFKNPYSLARQNDISQLIYQTLTNNSEQEELQRLRTTAQSCPRRNAFWQPSSQFNPFLFIPDASNLLPIDLSNYPLERNQNEIFKLYNDPRLSDPLNLTNYQANIKRVNNLIQRKVSKAKSNLNFINPIINEKLSPELVKAMKYIEKSFMNYPAQVQYYPCKLKHKARQQLQQRPQQQPIQKSKQRQPQRKPPKGPGYSNKLDKKNKAIDELIMRNIFI